MLEENKKPIGQLELSIRKYNSKSIGYVHLYYLIPEQRGFGIGRLLHSYAIQFFSNHNIVEYHLRVAPNNPRALAFYRKNGMQEIDSELDGKVIRMCGKLE